MLSLLAALVTVAGTVEAVQPRWIGDVIVTESRIRTDDGGLETVVQLGGTVDGIGMTFSHVPALVVRGDRVRVQLSEDRVVMAASFEHGATAYAAPVEVASYGLQRTTISGHALYRRSNCLYIAYDAAGTRTLPEGIEFAVIDQALAQWTTATQSCSDLSFHRGVIAGLPNARDGIDSIHFRDDRWCRPATGDDPELCYPAEATAVTRVIFVDDPTREDDGAILEADTDINSVGYALQVDGVVTTSSGIPVDALSVITHEVGHALGLAHDCGIDGSPWPTDAQGRRVPSCSDADAAHVAATMYYRVDSGDTSKRTLEATDVDGACELLADTTCQVEITGGCSTGAGHAPFGVLVLAPLLRRRRRCTLDSGRVAPGPRHHSRRQEHAVRARG